MQLEDKFHLTTDQNRRLAKMNLTRLVYTNSRFEGLTTTLPQTQTIIDGMGVSGVSVDDINVIVQLKRAWQYVIRQEKSLTFAMEKQINLIVARDDALVPGEIRTGNSEVAIANGETYVPPIPEETAEKEYFADLINDEEKSATDKALTLMYHNMRYQIFWDGNKRSATLAANKIMIDNGAGLINVPLDLWDTWNQLISEYYVSGEMDELKQWTYDNGVQGINL